MKPERRPKPEGSSETDGEGSAESRRGGQSRRGNPDAMAWGDRAEGRKAGTRCIPLPKPQGGSKPNRASREVIVQKASDHARTASEHLAPSFIGPAENEKRPRSHPARSLFVSHAYRVYASVPAL